MLLLRCDFRCILLRRSSVWLRLHRKWHLSSSSSSSSASSPLVVKHRRRLFYQDYVARQQIAVQMAAALLGDEPVVAVVAALLRRWNFVVVVQRNPMSSVGDFVLNETILSRRETIVIWYLHLVYTRFLTSKP